MPECQEQQSKTHISAADVRTLMNRLAPKPDGTYSSDADTEAAFRRLYNALPPLVSPCICGDPNGDFAP